MRSKLLKGLIIACMFSFCVTLFVEVSSAELASTQKVVTPDQKSAIQAAIDAVLNSGGTVQEAAAAGFAKAQSEGLNEIEAAEAAARLTTDSAIGVGTTPEAARTIIGDAIAGIVNAAGDTTQSSLRLITTAVVSGAARGAVNSGISVQNASNAAFSAGVGILTSSPGQYLNNRDFNNLVEGVAQGASAALTDAGVLEPETVKALVVEGVTNAVTEASNTSKIIQAVFDPTITEQQANEGYDSGSDNSEQNEYQPPQDDTPASPI